MNSIPISLKQYAELDIARGAVKVNFCIRGVRDKEALEKFR
jgi:hypothetical protein